MLYIFQVLYKKANKVRNYEVRLVELYYLYNPREEMLNLVLFRVFWGYLSFNLEGFNVER